MYNKCEDAVVCPLLESLTVFINELIVAGVVRLENAFRHLPGVDAAQARLQGGDFLHCIQFFK